MDRQKIVLGGAKDKRISGVEYQSDVNMTFHVVRWQPGV